MVYGFDWTAEHIRDVLVRLGYERVEGVLFGENFEVWVLDGDEDSVVQIPLIRQAPDYQRLCDRRVMGIVQYSSGSLERMQQVAGVLLDVRNGG